MKGKSSPTLLIVLAFFAIYVIWGSTYLLNKVAVNEIPPFFLAGIRFVTAGLLIFLIAAIMGKPIKISIRQWVNSGIAGFLFLTFGNGVVVWALKYVDSNFAALEISAQPLVILLMMWALQGKRIQAMSMVGVVLGILGIYLLVAQKNVMAQEHSLAGIVMIFLAMVAWAYGSLFVGKADLPQNYLVNTGHQMLIGGVMMLLVSPVLGESWSWPNSWSADVQVSMLLLVIFGSIVAFTSFNYLLKMVSPEKVATNTYVNPIVAMFLGWYFLNEQITTQSMAAAMVLLLGVYFINSKKKIKLLNRFKR